MKPPEILSLLEEASGTKMYEKKKQAGLVGALGGGPEGWAKHLMHCPTTGQCTHLRPGKQPYRACRQEALAVAQEVAQCCGGVGTWRCVVCCRCP